MDKEHQQADRRKGYVEVPASFMQKVEEHLSSFEDRRAACREVLSAGKQRMDNIELEMAKMTTMLNTADGFIKATRLMVSVVAILMTALVGLVVWIATEKNNDMRAVQKELTVQSIQINRTLEVVEHLVAAQRQNAERLERHLDSVNGRK